ncbi:MAG: hypothetical protein QOI10_182 [Solirubrobacterales bacterium]|nr:hypothetical protein [Solirubrobacterales bacterium]
MPDDSFNPLAAITTAIAEAAVKRRVRNVIKSYHHASDLLMEPIQNAVDEVSNAGIDTGVVRVSIDVDQDRIEVLDNGRGMTLDDARRFLAPDQGNKEELFREGRVRGHKGVGLTFLAYGFNLFELESRTDDEHFRIRLDSGRAWIEDFTAGLDEAPVAEITHDPEHPRVEGTGVSVVVVVGGHTQPSSLGRAFNSAGFARTTLEIQTALGVVPPYSFPDGFSLEGTLEYRRDARSETISLDTTYLFPHRRTPKGLRVFDLGEYLEKDQRSTSPPAKLRKKFHACHWTVSPDELAEFVDAEAEPESLPDRDSLVAKIKELDVYVYGLFAYSVDYRNQLGAAWSVPGNRAIHYPGFRIATDGMISSWRRETALTHRGFYVDRVWLVYHFRSVEPDLGRKDFPPEVLEIVSLTEESFANELVKLSTPFMRPTPKQRVIAGDHVSPENKASERKKTPLDPSNLDGFGEIPFLSTPAEEQDVVGLFNELIGMGVFAHIRPVYLSGVDDYDGWVEIDPAAVPDEMDAVLPGLPELPSKQRTGVIEFKYQASDVLNDTVNETKDWTELDLLVCWVLGQDGRSYGGDEIQFAVAEDEGDRGIAGVTHLATLTSKGDVAVPVVALKTVLEALDS